MNEKLRFEVKAKNNRLHELIFKDHKTLKEFCDLEQIPYQPVCAFLNLSLSPYGLDICKAGKMNYHAMRLCEIFSQDPLELFPPELYTKGNTTKWVIKKNINTLTMQEASRPCIEYMPDVSTARPMESVLSTLSEREQIVIKKRYGFNESTPQTLEDVAKSLKVTRERIRQIEAKAIRKLRHKSRSNILKNSYGG